MINELKKILLEKGDTRKVLIQNFQNYIWNNDQLPYDKEIEELLRDLAYDLDFCDTDNCIDTEIELTLQKIQKLGSIKKENFE